MRNSSALPPRARILIVRLSSIGDVLHTTTVVHNLRRLAPDAEITWLASPPASTLLETNPDIDRLVDSLHRNKGELVGNYVKLAKQDSKEIYRLAL